MTALEVLSSRSPRTGKALEVVRKVQQLVDDEITAARVDGTPEDELRQLESLRGATKDLASESISSAIRGRVVGLAADQTEESALRKQVSTTYGARSQLIHSGRTSTHLADLLGALESWVAEASLPEQDEAPL